MGELEDYYVILGEVKYVDDPMKYGRIKADIPGIIHSSEISAEAFPDAMPWVRPFKMYGYQTFSKPVVGQKVWILVSKTNYNEYWWFPYHEMLDFVQKFIEENYENQPEVFNARYGSSGECIFTYDDEHGYTIRLDKDYLNLNPDREMAVAFNDCRMMIKGNKTYCGGGDDTGSYEPCVMGKKCEKMRSEIASIFKRLDKLCAGKPYVGILSGDNAFAGIAKNLNTNILGEWLKVN